MATEHPNTFSFTVITDRVDGNGNQADIDGWDMTRFNANPVVFFNHRWNDPPIGRALGLQTHTDHIVATIQLAPTQLGEQIALMLADGYIRGASAGWKPLDWELNISDRGFPTGIHSHRQELLELSVVGLPAQPDTLKQALNAASHIDWTPSHVTAGFNDLDTIIGAVPRELQDLPSRGFGPTPTLQDIIDTLKLYNSNLRGGP